MKALIVEPGKDPRIENIENNMYSLQKIVEGYIEVVYPFDDTVCIICNEEGKILGLPPNRPLQNYRGETVDVLSGTFLVVGDGGEVFCDLTDEQIEKYERKFRL